VACPQYARSRGKTQSRRTVAAVAAKGFALIAVASANGHNHSEGNAMPKDGQVIGPDDPALASGPAGNMQLPAERNAIEPLAIVALVTIPLLAFWAVVTLPATETIPAGGGLILALFIPVLCALSVVMKYNRSIRREQGALPDSEI
jgi:hypothetical protein